MNTNLQRGVYGTKSSGSNLDNPDLVKEQLDRIANQVKEAGEKAIKQAEQSGKLSQETKETVDKLLTKQGELELELKEMQQRLDRRGNSDNVKSMDLGQQLVCSDEFKEYLQGSNFKSNFTMAVKAITSALDSAGVLVQPQQIPGIVSPAMQRMTIRDLITPGKTNSNLIQYPREVGFTNAAATTTETTRKPESKLTFESKTSPVVKIPHFIKASTEILADAPMLSSYINGRLIYGLQLAEEAQLLNGSGVGNNLSGLNTVASTYAAPIAIENATRIDTLRLALLQAELAGYPSSGIVLNPIDWTAIELTKDSSGSYIFANPQLMSQPNMWGRPVVSTISMTANNFLCGAFKLGAQVFDRQQASITIATENEDDFVNNLVTILAEERLALAVYRPEAFVKGTLTTA